MEDLLCRVAFLLNFVEQIFFTSLLLQAAFCWQDNPAFVRQSIEAGLRSSLSLSAQKAELLEAKASLKLQIVQHRLKGLSEITSPDLLRAELRALQVSHPLPEM